MRQLALGEASPVPVSREHAAVLAAAEAARAACLDGPKGGFVAPPPQRPPKKREKRAAAGQEAFWKREERPGEKRPQGERLGTELRDEALPNQSRMQAALSAARRPCPELPRRLVRAEEAVRERVYLDAEGTKIAVRVALPEGDLYFARHVDKNARMGLGQCPPDDEARRMIAEAFPAAAATIGRLRRGCWLVCREAAATETVIDEWLRRQEERLRRLQREVAPPRPRPADSTRTRGPMWHKAKAWLEARRGGE